jgi:hypothetical protein
MRWCLLIHQIPPKPLYLRAKVRQRLSRIGAVSLKNSVYVLPWSDDALEDFQWIAQEITAGGGQAFICAGEILAGVTEGELRAQFNAERTRQYEQLRDEVRQTAGDAKEPVVARLRQRLSEVRAVDFFDAPARKEIDRMIQKIETRLRKPAPLEQPKRARVSGKTWVTRRGVKVDRIASAWLIRRFIDSQARFRFVDAAGWKKKADELAFDITGGDYTHDGDLCTFETLLASFGPKDTGLRHIAEIVHDIDLKDERYARPDTAGIKQLIEGIVAAYARDDDRLDRGFALFDDLHSSFQRGRRGRK